MGFMKGMQEMRKEIFFSLIGYDLKTMLIFIYKVPI